MNTRPQMQVLLVGNSLTEGTAARSTISTHNRVAHLHYSNCSTSCTAQRTWRERALIMEAPTDVAAPAPAAAAAASPYAPGLSGADSWLWLVS